MTCCGKIAHGAAGLIKAALRIDRAPRVVVLARRGMCRRCEHGGAGRLTTWTRCNECGCNIAAKTVIGAEACCRGKWTKTKGAE